MNYNYIRLVLIILGTLIGFAGYYLDSVVRIRQEGLLWLGITLILIAGGFVIGGLIQKLSLHSHTDFLTGIYNRRYFYQQMEYKAAGASMKRMPLCLAMIDVDEFKAINDTYGHFAGDQIITNLANILSKNVRETDIVARWGGDEFGVIFPMTSLEEAVHVMESIRAKVEQAYKSNYGLTISVGIVSHRSGQDKKDLLIKVDQALYRAKNYKNSVVTETDY